MPRHLYLFILTIVFFYSSTSWLKAQQPVAQFGITEAGGCAPLTTGFANISDFATAYQWLFPGGTPAASTLFEPEVTYTVPGNYTISLIASNEQGADTSSFTITVFDPPPVVNFGFQLDGRTAQFTNESQAANFYVWDFGDGFSSNEIHPTHTYTEQGTYMVRLTAINDCDSRTHTDVLVLYESLNIPTHTANDQIPVSDTEFLPGTNLGYFPPWQDTQLADIAAGNPEVGQEGVGVKTIRPLLPEHFLEEWGYDIRVDAFEHYKKLKLKDNTMIIGFPSEEHRDTTRFCPDHQSEMFANLYTPIWDNGANGTPVNDNNPYALYLWRMVNLYGDNIKFWEIWNEPGFDYTFLTGFLDPGADGNWWENNPDPCDYKLRAPIYHYIRTLRISYEVIKTIQPEAHITLASVGYPSFMDAILRNTDNPIDGSPTPDYPLGGGAYFDVVTIHAYPHFDGSVRSWDEATQSFVYDRHTDKAAEGIGRTKGLYQEVLASYGYDGLTYPAKKWIITEIAVPRKPFGDYFGSDELQINYMIKSYVACIKNDIEAMHIYDMSESHFLDDAVSEFQLMGLFQRLFGVLPYQQVQNQQAIAYKTTSDLLYGSTYDPEQEAAMNLPEGIRGAAFLDKNGHYTYLLWAATTIDNSEFATGNYSFPASFNIQTLEQREWNFSATQIALNSGSENISLNGRPVFFTDKNNRVPIAPTAQFTLESQEGCVPMTVQFTDASTTNTTMWNWNFPGGTPDQSNEQHPQVIYTQPGVYPVTLEVSNANGTNTLTQSDFITVAETLPEADFDIEINGIIVSFVNRSVGATEYYWDLADGNSSTLAHPTNDYNIDGFYDVKLIARNGCGADTMIQTIIINPDEVLPYPDFSAETRNGCGPLTVQFTDESSENTTGWWWQFQGGTPAHSSEQHPVVVFEDPGNYFVQLSASTNAGDRTKFRAEYIEVTDAPPQALYTTGDSGLEIFLYNNSIDAQRYTWLFGDGNNSTDENPTHIYESEGIYTIRLIAENNCGRDTMTQTIEVTDMTTGTTDHPAVDRWSVFPNPGNGQFMVQLEAAPASQPVHLMVYDLRGQLIFSTEHNFTAGALYQSIDLSTLPGGAYQIMVRSTEWQISKRIVKYNR